MFTTLWKRLGQSRRPSARPAPALRRKSLRLEALEDRLALSALMPLGDPSGCSCPAAVPAQSLCTETQHTVEDLIRLRRVVQDAAPTLAPAASPASEGGGHSKTWV